MSVVPGGLETDQQPPMTIPLRHFVVGFGFLLLGSSVAGAVSFGIGTPLASLAHVHLFLVGWVCVTIMGAMTQFVPVWSGVTLHSERLARLQLWLVGIGLLGFAGGLVAGSVTWLFPFGGLMLGGFWMFVYNLTRTLWRVEGFDKTERHFAFALGCFGIVTTLGFLLVVDFVHPVLRGSALTRSNVVAAHATLAVFGAVLATVLGALYQLATMFTQSELHGIDIPLQRVEGVAYPLGVVLLALGRLFAVAPLARVGGLLIAASLFGFGIILARRLIEARVPWTPMLSRYAVLAPTMGLWSVFALVAWNRDPIARSTLFGAPGSVHLLGLGVIGFVVLGTLYHIVPFIIWVHRYSDRLGFEDVPMIDDLYNDRLASVDFSCFLGGLVVVVGADFTGTAPRYSGVGGGLVLIGAVLFTANMVSTIRTHSPRSGWEILFGGYGSREGGTSRKQGANEPSP